MIFNCKNHYFLNVIDFKILNGKFFNYLNIQGKLLFQTKTEIPFIFVQIWNNEVINRDLYYKLNYWIGHSKSYFHQLVFLILLWNFHYWYFFFSHFLTLNAIIWKLNYNRRLQIKDYTQIFDFFLNTFLLFQYFITK